MKFILGIIVFILSVTIPLCFGQDSHKALLERIEAVEARDIVESARIQQLERQVQTSNHKLNHISALNLDLHTEHATLKQKLADQDVTIATLKNDLAYQKSIGDKTSQTVAVLKSTVTELDATVSMLKRTFGHSKNSFKNLPYHLKSTKSDQQLKQSNYMKYYGSTGLSDNDMSGNNLDIQYINDGQRNNTTTVQIEKSETVGLQDSMTGFIGQNNEHKKQSKRRKEPKERQTGHVFISSKQRSATNIVAFHAVIKPHKVTNLRMNDVIKFETVLLNEGGGYHNLHGLFIAPKPGFYLFSVTLATDYAKSFYAELEKNGATLLNLSGNGQPGDHLDQSSGTAVTKLNAGDEVWVKHFTSTNGTIWGNYYSSFTGVLLTDFE